MAEHPLDAVRLLAEAARLRQDETDQARYRRDAAIRQAYQHGCTVRQIASAAGMSYQRVSQLVRD